jgi:hypothetical protein
MSDDHRYQQLLDGFGAELARAQAQLDARRTRRRRLTLGGLATAAALATVLVLLGIGGGGGRSLDVLAQARAALSPPREIVHLVVTQKVLSSRTSGRSQPITTEQWSAVDPPRWRMSFDDARYQVAYAHGTTRNYNVARNTLEVYRGYSDRGVVSKAPGMFSNDPVAGLRAMLASGKLHDAGEVTVAGRTVRRLVGVQRIPQPHGHKFVQRTTYDLDPRTFAPIGGTLQFDLGRAHKVTVGFHVDRYERLPLTPENTKLLTIQTNAQTKVTVHDRKRR